MMAVRLPEVTSALTCPVVHSAPRLWCASRSVADGLCPRAWSGCDLVHPTKLSHGSARTAYRKVGPKPARSEAVEQALLRTIEAYLAGSLHLDHFAQRFDDLLFAAAPADFRSAEHRRLFAVISEQIAFVLPDDAAPGAGGALLNEMQLKAWLRGALQKETARAESNA